MGSLMQCVQNGSKTFFGFRWVPHITLIKTKDVLLGTFDAKSRCVEYFFKISNGFFSVFSRANAQIM
jgi:hypothetical protein